MYKNTIKRLLKKLEEDESESIDFEHPMFIDLIEIDPDYMSIVDIALKNNMFVFIVETGMLLYI